MTDDITLSAAAHLQTTSAARLYESLRRTRPTTKQDLKNYIKVFLGIDIPDKQICEGHNSPLDYLMYSFNCDFANPKPANADCVVWANRGGGKTDLAAVATLLDCIFKPSCQVRILAGSEDQAGRMYQYLTGFLHNGFEQYLDGPVRKAGCRFVNGSSVDVLTQSQASVRGQHIQKLRCDEVELFDPDVFNAAKFTTQSANSIIAANGIYQHDAQTLWPYAKNCFIDSEKQYPGFQMVPVGDNRKMHRQKLLTMPAMG